MAISWKTRKVHSYWSTAKVTESYGRGHRGNYTIGPEFTGTYPDYSRSGTWIVHLGASVVSRGHATLKAAKASAERFDAPLANPRRTRKSNPVAVSIRPSRYGLGVSVNGRMLTDQALSYEQAWDVAYDHMTGVLGMDGKAANRLIQRAIQQDVKYSAPGGPPRRRRNPNEYLALVEQSAYAVAKERARGSSYHGDNERSLETALKMAQNAGVGPQARSIVRRVLKAAPTPKLSPGVAFTRAKAREARRKMGGRAAYIQDRIFVRNPSYEKVGHRTPKQASMKAIASGKYDRLRHWLDGVESKAFAERVGQAQGRPSSGYSERQREQVRDLARSYGATESEIANAEALGRKRADAHVAKHGR